MHKNSPFIITVDGPSGSGKGTLSERIAERYNLAFLDTGMLYRAVAAKVLSRGRNPDDKAAIIQIAQNMQNVSFDKEKLRNDRVAVMASKIAAIPEVRLSLLEYQRSFARSTHESYTGVILDGRDTGTVICPEAQFKFYLTSAVEVRAQRRHKELQQMGIESIYSEVLSDMITRDQRDSSRDISPLRPAIDAHIIDTSQKTIDEVFMQVCHIIDEGLKV